MTTGDAADFERVAADARGEVIDATTEAILDTADTFHRRDNPTKCAGCRRVFVGDAYTMKRARQPRGECRLQELTGSAVVAVHCPDCFKARIKEWIDDALRACGL